MKLPHAHRRRATDLPFEIVKECVVLMICLAAMYVAMIAMLAAR